MHFDTAVDLKSIAGFCLRAKEIATIGAWRRRWEIFEKQSKDNPLLREYIEQHFPVECAMYEFDRYYRITRRISKANIEKDRALFGLYKFSAILTRVYDRLSPVAKDRLSKRLYGALSEDEGISNISFELSTCAHLILRGFDVTWSDLENNGGFDFLAVKGDVEFEVECKTFSGDVGRKIHLRRQYQLAGLIYKSTWDALATRDTLLIEIVVPDRLSGGDLDAISRVVRGALKSNADNLGPRPCRVSLATFDVENSPLRDFGRSGQFVRGDVERFVGEHFNSVCRHLLVMGNKRKVAVIAIRTLGEDDAVKGIYRALKNGCGQFSGRRPSMLCAQLQDVSSAQLAELAGVQGNGLQVVITDLFKNSTRSHLHTVVFSTPSDAPQVRRTVAGGIVKWDYIDQYAGYVFRNERNPEIEKPGLLVFGVGGQ